MSYRVLVLEDDEDLRETLSELLAEEGYQVVSVSRGEEAVRWAARETFDLIVSDIRMDGMDGLEAIDQTKKLQPQMGSLVVSGYASEKETLRAIHLNVGGYLRKPFSLKDFLQSVRSVLEKQTAQLRHTRELEEHREALAWAMETLAEHSDQLPWTRLSRALAGHLGLSSDSAFRAAWGTQLALSPKLAAGAPSLVQPAPGTAEARVVEFTRRRAQDLDLAEADAELAEAYERARAGLPFEAWQAPQERSLLALGEALEHSQDHKAAAQAYREVYDRTRAQPTLSTVQAALGLARLEDVREWTGRVRELQGALGPRAASQALCEAGILLAQMDPAAGMACIREALPRLEGALAARARLALHHFGQPQENVAEAAQQLLDPAAQAELSPWLFAEVLSHAPAGRPMARAIFNLSPMVAALVPQLGEQAMQNLLSSLETQDFGAPEELLQVLLGDTRGWVRQRALQLQGKDGAPSLRLQSFGVFQVFYGAQRIPEAQWRTQKIKYLLAYLANAARPVSEDELLEVFWPDVRGSAKRNLYVATTSLRKALRPNENTREVDYLVRERNTLYLNPELPIWHDAQQAEQCWAEASLQRLVTLYGGPFLDGCYMDWAVRRRATWEERAAVALLRLAHDELQAGRAQEALEYANRSLEIDSGRLEAHACKLRAYLSLRQPDAVTRHFEACEKMLRREYELEPSTEMLELYQRARHGIF